MEPWVLVLQKCSVWFSIHFKRCNYLNMNNLTTAHLICRVLSFNKYLKINSLSWIASRHLSSFESSSLVLITNKEDKICNRLRYQGRKSILRQSYILVFNLGAIQILMGRKPTYPGPENVNSVRTRNKSQAGEHHRHIGFSATSPRAYGSIS